MGCKGVREPLYIYGLCRTGGSGAVKWSRAPKPSLNSKYITESGIRGDGDREGSVLHHKNSSLNYLTVCVVLVDEYYT